MSHTDLWVMSYGHNFLENNNNFENYRLLLEKMLDQYAQEVEWNPKDTPVLVWMQNRRVLNRLSTHSPLTEHSLIHSLTRSLTTY